MSGKKVKKVIRVVPTEEEKEAEIRRARHTKQPEHLTQGQQERITWKSKRSQWGKLERGWRRRVLIVQLAESNTPQSQLAREHGVTQVAIHRFNKRHMAEIEEVRNRAGDELATLWITKKVNRLAELQEDVMRLDDQIAYYHETGRYINPLIVSEKRQLLRAVAEELGELKNHINVNSSSSLKHQIQGVDMEDLK